MAPTDRRERLWLFVLLLSLAFAGIGISRASAGPLSEPSCRPLAAGLPYRVCVLSAVFPAGQG